MKSKYFLKKVFPFRWSIPFSSRSCSPQSCSQLHARPTQAYPQHEWAWEEGTRRQREWPSLRMWCLALPRGYKRARATHSSVLRELPQRCLVSVAQSPLALTRSLARQPVRGRATRSLGSLPRVPSPGTCDATPCSALALAQPTKATVMAGARTDAPVDARASQAPFA